MDLSRSEIRKSRFSTSSEVSENLLHDQLIYFLSFDFLINFFFFKLFFPGLFKHMVIILEKTKNKYTENIMSNLT